MKIRIQSKSGDYNSTFHSPSINGLDSLMKLLRTNGGYYAIHREKEIFVPFEEIEYIEKMEQIN